MSKINNQSNRLDKINFVQDITSETAANHSGGVDLSDTKELRGGALVAGGDPDLIVYEDANEERFGLSVNAATGTSIAVFENEFAFLDDRISPVRILRSNWRFFKDPFYCPRVYGQNKIFVCCI